MPEPYEFTSDPSPVELNVTYKFETARHHIYAITFIEVTKVIDLFDTYQIISNAIHIVVDPIQINMRLDFDARIGATITKIIKDYLNHIENHSLLIFICDSKDGKQLKRKEKFDRWFNQYKSEMKFEKYDQEILEPDDYGNYVSTFISLIFGSDHPQKHNILREMEQLKQEMGVEKLGNNEDS